jgi:translocation and assembly module TamA
MRWVASIAGCLACVAFAQDAPRPAAEPGAEDPRRPPERVREAEEENERDSARRRDPSRNPLAAHAIALTWNAPQPLKGMYEKYLPPPQVMEGQRRAAALRPWERDIRRRVPEIAASEGYFSATVEITYDGDEREHATVTVTPGPRTVVGDIDIEFLGDLSGEGDGRAERRREIRESWSMKAGQPFRSADWDVAKTKLEESLTDLDYAAGSVSTSRAEVDAEAARAHLKLTLDSGPRFTLGEPVIEGLELYPDAVVKRVLDLKAGERYSRERLSTQQRLIQYGPWFSSVVVEIERDPSKPNRVPVKIAVTERPEREVGLALGYGTDDGARVEALYRDRNLFKRGFDLQTSVRVAQKQQFGYADVYLPSGLFSTKKYGDVPFTDSVGVLAEHSVIQNLALSRFAVAGYRHFKLDMFEFRAGLSYQIERAYPEGSDVELKRALAPIFAVTWRHVDNLYDPTHGGVLNVQVAAGAKNLASGDDFVKLYGNYQYWIPLGPMNQLLLRTEIGRTFAQSRENIPEDFLYRAGGSRSNRGYAYQSLGPKEGDAVVGGRYLATGTIEFVHWLDQRWGAAAFLDVGEASDSIGEWEALRSYGLGARFKTPAGPFALDVAYAERDRKFRLAFSVTIAF